MKIVDAFTFFNEIELLKIRLELLYDHVDAFCICEGRYTFTGNKKPYYVELYQEDLTPWLDKIIYLKFEPDITGLDFSKKDSSFNPNSPAWHMERAQRNSLAEVCSNLSGTDVLIVSDLDELPNPLVINRIRTASPALAKSRLEMQMHYYFMNCVGTGAMNSKWHKAFFASVDEIKKNRILSSCGCMMKCQRLLRLVGIFRIWGVLRKSPKRLMQYLILKSTGQKLIINRI